MKDEITKCPECGSEDSKEIVYGFPDKKTLKRAESGEIVLAANPNWPDGPDRKCACEKKYFSDPVAQKKNDEDTALQMARIEAQKSGRYHLFSVWEKTTADMAREIVAEIRARRAKDAKVEEPGSE